MAAPPACTRPICFAPKGSRDPGSKGRRQIHLIVFLLLALGAGALALLLGGCQSQQVAQRRPEPPELGHQGTAWEVVFSSPLVSQANPNPRANPEYARNDAALNIQPNTPLLATAEWPERERDDLYYPRRVYLSPNPHELLFFDKESRYRTAYWRYQGTPNPAYYYFRGR